MTQAYCEIVTSVANMQERKEGRSRVQSILAALEERIKSSILVRKESEEVAKAMFRPVQGRMLNLRIYMK